MGKWAIPKGKDAMRNIGRSIRVILCLLLFVPLGCTHNGSPSVEDASSPVVRVRVLQAQEKVMVAASEPPLVTSPTNPQGQRLNFPPGIAVPVALAPNGGWQVGNR